MKKYNNRGDSGWLIAMLPVFIITWFLIMSTTTTTHTGIVTGKFTEQIDGEIHYIFTIDGTTNISVSNEQFIETPVGMEVDYRPSQIYSTEEMLAERNPEQEEGFLLNMNTNFALLMMIAGAIIILIAFTTFSPTRWLIGLLDFGSGTKKRKKSGAGAGRAMLVGGVASGHLVSQDEMDRITAQFNNRVQPEPEEEEEPEPESNRVDCPHCGKYNTRLAGNKMCQWCGKRLPEELR